MPDTLTQTVTHESLTTDSGSTMLLTLLATTLLSQGIRGPAGPAGGSDVATPTFPVVDPVAVANVVAGDSANLDSLVLPNQKIGKLQQVTLSCSAACKWEIKKSTAGIDTTFDIVFTSGVSGNVPSHEWEPPHADYTDLAGNGVNTFFRVVATNLDARNSATCYATYYFDEVDV